MGAKTPKQLPAISVLKQHIQQDDIGQGLFRQRQRSRGIAFALQTVARIGCVALKKLKRIGIVINRQHGNLAVCRQREANFTDLIADRIRIVTQRPARETEQLMRHSQTLRPLLRRRRHERAKAGD